MCCKSFKARAPLRLPSVLFQFKANASATVFFDDKEKASKSVNLPKMLRLVPDQPCKTFFLHEIMRVVPNTIRPGPDISAYIDLASANKICPAHDQHDDRITSHLCPPCRHGRPHETSVRSEHGRAYRPSVSRVPIIVKKICFQKEMGEFFMLWIDPDQN